MVGLKQSLLFLSIITFSLFLVPDTSQATICKKKPSILKIAKRQLKNSNRKLLKANLKHTRLNKRLERIHVKCENNKINSTRCNSKLSRISKKLELLEFKLTFLKESFETAKTDLEVAKLQLSECPIPVPEEAGIIKFTGTAKSFVGWDGNCSSEKVPFIGFKPRSRVESFPLFIWLHGTADNYKGEYIELTLREMVKKGFVSVSPHYGDIPPVLSCTDLKRKTSCLFDATKPDSVIAKMCAKPFVDCSKGIVVGGHSQGSQIALLARNYDQRVRAAHLLSTTCSDIYGFPSLCDPAGDIEYNCMLAQNTMLPVNRIRIVSGEDDGFGSQQSFELISGKACSEGAYNCLNSDGSGWYRISNTEVQDGSADHCHIVNSPQPDGWGCIPDNPPFDKGWLPSASNEWSLLPNLEWLASFTD